MASYEILVIVAKKNKQTNKQTKKNQDILLAGKWEQKEKYFCQY